MTFACLVVGQVAETIDRSILANLCRIYAATTDLDPGEGRLDLAKILGRELDINRAHVLAQAIHVARDRYGNNPRLLRH